jgi:virginiamycin B lyase
MTITSKTTGRRTAGRYRILPKLATVAAALAATAVCLSPGYAAPTVKYSVKNRTVGGMDFTIYTKKSAGSGALRIATLYDYIWFAENTNGGNILRLGPDGKAKQFDPPEPGLSIHALGPGPSNRIWFAGFNKGTIGNINKKGVTHTFPTGLASNNANDLLMGPKGYVWFPTNFNGLGRTSKNGDTEFFPIDDNSDQPTTLTAQGKKIWYIEWLGNEIGYKVSPNGPVQEYTIGFSGFSNSFGIAYGADGRIWFADPQRQRICRIKTNGDSLKCFTDGLSGSPATIIAGPDGNLYFGEYEGYVGRISTSGDIVDYKIPLVADGQLWPVLGMTVGPNGDIWFANNSEPRIGVMHLD